MRIGVFDSGVGGKAVAAKIRLAFPSAEVLVVNDSTHVPYGSKPAATVLRYTIQAIQPLIKNHCDIVILACNTATAVAIETLRQRYPDTPFVGLEPMLKTAAGLTGTGTVAIFATPATLSSKRYTRLKEQFATNIEVLEPDCSHWASMIEHSRIDDVSITENVDGVLAQNADVIVLGCTHYHWIEELIAERASSAKVIEPSAAVVRQISSLTGQTAQREFTDCINCSPLSP